MKRIIFGSLLAVFGAIGFAVEIDNYQSNGSWDYHGLMLAAMFLFNGGAMILFGKKYLDRKKTAK